MQPVMVKSCATRSVRRKIMDLPLPPFYLVLIAKRRRAEKRLISEDVSTAHESKKPRCGESNEATQLITANCDANEVEKRKSSGKETHLQNYSLHPVDVVNSRETYNDSKVFSVKKDPRLLNYVDVNTVAVVTPVTNCPNSIQISNVTVGLSESENQKMKSEVIKDRNSRSDSSSSSITFEDKTVTKLSANSTLPVFDRGNNLKGPTNVALIRPMDVRDLKPMDITQLTANVTGRINHTHLHCSPPLQNVKESEAEDKTPKVAYIKPLDNGSTVPEKSDQDTSVTSFVYSSPKFESCDSSVQSRNKDGSEHLNATSGSSSTQLSHENQQQKNEHQPLGINQVVATSQRESSGNSVLCSKIVYNASSNDNQKQKNETDLPANRQISILDNKHLGISTSHSTLSVQQNKVEHDSSCHKPQQEITEKENRFIQRAPRSYEEMRLFRTQQIRQEIAKKSAKVNPALDRAKVKDIFSYTTSGYHELLMADFDSSCPKRQKINSDFPYNRNFHRDRRKHHQSCERPTPKYDNDIEETSINSDIHNDHAIVNSVTSDNCQIGKAGAMEDELSCKNAQNIQDTNILTSEIQTTDCCQLTKNSENEGSAQSFDVTSPTKCNIKENVVKDLKTLQVDSLTDISSASANICENDKRKCQFSPIMPKKVLKSLEMNELSNPIDGRDTFCTPLFNTSEESVTALTKGKKRLMECKSLSEGIPEVSASKNRTLESEDNCKEHTESVTSEDAVTDKCDEYSKNSNNHDGRTSIEVTSLSFDKANAIINDIQPKPFDTMKLLVDSERVPPSESLDEGQKISNLQFKTSSHLTNTSEPEIHSDKEGLSTGTKSFVITSKIRHLSNSKIKCLSPCSGERLLEESETVHHENLDMDDQRDVISRSLPVLSEKYPLCNDVTSKSPFKSEIEHVSDSNIQPELRTDVCGITSCSQETCFAIVNAGNNQYKPLMDDDEKSLIDNSDCCKTSDMHKVCIAAEMPPQSESEVENVPTDTMTVEPSNKDKIIISSCQMVCISRAELNKYGDDNSQSDTENDKKLICSQVTVSNTEYLPENEADDKKQSSHFNAEAQSRIDHNVRKEETPKSSQRNFETEILSFNNVEAPLLKDDEKVEEGLATDHLVPAGNGAENVLPNNEHLFANPKITLPERLTDECYSSDNDQPKDGMLFAVNSKLKNTIEIANVMSLSEKKSQLTECNNSIDSLDNGSENLAAEFNLASRIKRVKKVLFTSPVRKKQSILKNEKDMVSLVKSTESKNQCTHSSSNIECENQDVLLSTSKSAISELDVNQSPLTENAETQSYLSSSEVPRLLEDTIQEMENPSPNVCSKNFAVILSANDGENILEAEESFHDDMANSSAIFKIESVVSLADGAIFKDFCNLEDGHIDSEYEMFNYSMPEETSNTSTAVVSNTDNETTAISNDPKLKKFHEIKNITESDEIISNADNETATNSNDSKLEKTEGIKNITESDEIKTCFPDHEIQLSCLEFDDGKYKVAENEWPANIQPVSDVSQLDGEAVVNSKNTNEGPALDVQPEVESSTNHLSLSGSHNHEDNANAHVKSFRNSMPEKSLEFQNITQSDKTKICLSGHTLQYSHMELNDGRCVTENELSATTQSVLDVCKSSGEVVGKSKNANQTERLASNIQPEAEYPKNNLPLLIAHTHEDNASTHVELNSALINQHKQEQIAQMQIGTELQSNKETSQDVDYYSEQSREHSVIIETIREEENGIKCTKESELTVTNSETLIGGSLIESADNHISSVSLYNNSAESSICLESEQNNSTVLCNSSSSSLTVPATLVSEFDHGEVKEAKNLSKHQPENIPELPPVFDPSILPFGDIISSFKSNQSISAFLDSGLSSWDINNLQGNQETNPSHSNTPSRIDHEECLNFDADMIVKETKDQLHDDNKTVSSVNAANNMGLGTAFTVNIENCSSADEKDVFCNVVSDLSWLLLSKQDASKLEDFNNIKVLASSGNIQMNEHTKNDSIDETASSMAHQKSDYILANLFTSQFNVPVHSQTTAARKKTSEYIFTDLQSPLLFDDVPKCASDSETAKSNNCNSGPLEALVTEETELLNKLSADSNMFDGFNDSVPVFNTVDQSIINSYSSTDIRQNLTSRTENFHSIAPPVSYINETVPRENSNVQEKYSFYSLEQFATAVSRDANSNFSSGHYQSTINKTTPQSGTVQLCTSQYVPDVTHHNPFIRQPEQLAHKSSSRYGQHLARNMFPISGSSNHGSHNPPSVSANLATYLAIAQPSYPLNNNASYQTNFNSIMLFKGASCCVCNKPATTQCAACRNVYYCSGNCAMIFWNRGHSGKCLNRLSAKQNP